MAAPAAESGKYFANAKKGELQDLKNELNGDTKERRKNAIKKTIASMTVGKDVGPLFPDVLKNMQAEDLETKKLVYLYLMNYAKSHPEIAILAVNTFVKDVEDANPLLRALAIRTMGCIRVDKILDYLSLPLGKGLKDADPYVRKTAVLAVAKFYDLSPTICEQNGFLEELEGMLSDSNPMVVANAVAALADIYDESGKDIIAQNPQLLNKLLAALNECNEWGQVFILDALAKYKPGNSRDAESICERVSPRLTHANAAVVLSAVKALFQMITAIDNRDVVAQLYVKMAPPLVTLLASEPEVQYIALRNIDLILRKVPQILSQDIRVFFCKYNDPPYVKLEKLDIIVRLTTDKNIEYVLAELKEYASEVDVEFVRRAVGAIGRIAVRMDRATERCISALLDLIKTKVNYVVQEAIVVIKDIFRKYPNQYESLIPVLTESLENLDEPEAKASMIWILGEYADRIDNAHDLLEQLTANFEEDSVHVQLQLLTAAVKLFLKKPATGQTLVQRVLQLATTGSDNPDLRDRGYIYWRLLSSDPATAKAVVLAEKPPIANSSETLSGSVLDELIANLGTLASVYHKPAASFLSTGKVAPLSVKQLQKQAEDEREDGALGDGAAQTPQAESGANGGDNLLDLDLLGDSVPAGGAGGSGAPASAPGGMDDLLDLLGGSDLTSAKPKPAAAATAATGGAKPVLLSREAGSGMEVQGLFVRRGGQIALDLTFVNHTAAPMSDFGIQFNKNSFALAPVVPLRVNPIAGGGRADVSLPLNFAGQRAKTDPINVLQLAFKNQAQVFYGQTTVPLEPLMGEDGRLEPAAYMQFWQENPSEHKTTVAGLNPRSLLQIATRLPARNVYVSGTRQANGVDSYFTSVKLGGFFVVLLQLDVAVAQATVYVTARSNITEFLKPVTDVVEAVLRG
jgi:AP-1 complex subunit beta-1